MYTVYNSVNAVKLDCNTWLDAQQTAKRVLKTIPTRNGFVAPVSIFRHGSLVGVVSDGTDGVQVHRLTPDGDLEDQFERNGYCSTQYPEVVQTPHCIWHND